MQIMTSTQIKRIVYRALYTAYEYWQFVFLPLFLVPILVFIVMLNGDKQYQNHASILVEENSLLNPYLSDISLSYSVKTRIEALKTLVLGRGSLTTIIKQQNLIENPNNQGELEAMQETLSEAVSISLIGNELVRVDLNWHDKAQMKPLLDAIVTQFIAKLVNPAQTSVESSEAVINQQLNDLTHDLEQAKDALAMFKSKHETELSEVLHVNQDLLNQLNIEKQKRVVELNGAQAQLVSLKSQLNELDPINGRLQDDISTLQDDIALLRKRYTDNHSKIQSKIAELKVLTARNNELKTDNVELNDTDIKRLWHEASNAPANYININGSLLASHIIDLKTTENTIAKTHREIEMLDMQISKVLKGLARSTQIDKTLSRLEKDYLVKQTLYDEMLEKYEISRVTRKIAMSEGPNKVKTIERAFSPTKAITLPLFLQLMIAISLGVLVSMCITFVLILSERRVRDIHTIEVITDKPVLTIIPNLHN